LGEVAGDRTTDYEEMLGYHLEQSFRYRRELPPDGPRTRDLAARASALLASSGRQASARSDVNAAVSLLSRAASLVPSDDSARPELLLELGAALRTAQQLPEAGQVLADALERARANGDGRIEWRANMGPRGLGGGG